jgi:hypothetical protein
VSYLILDGFLGLPAKVYDGSWIEWGYLVDTAEEGPLPADSPWLTNTPARSESVTYNVDNGEPVESIAGDVVDPYAPHANLINVQDENFGGGGGPGGGFETPGY